MTNPVRIYECWTDGRTDGYIRTVENHDIFYVPFATDFYMSQPDQTPIKCLFLLAPDGYTTREFVEQLTGRDIVGAKVAFTVEGKLIRKYRGASAVAIEFPGTGFDALYNLCNGLYAVYAYSEALREDVVLIAPKGAVDSANMIGYQPGVEYGSVECFAAGVVHEGAEKCISIPVEDWFDEDQVKELLALSLNRMGYLNAMADDITVEDLVGDAGFGYVFKKGIYEDLANVSKETANVSSIDAWLRAMDAIEVVDGTLTVNEAKASWLAYKPGTVVFPEPTPEEVHPPQPEVPEETPIDPEPTPETPTV